MALQDRWMPIRLSVGVDTESDDKTLTPGTPTELRNAVFEKRVSIQKRTGTERLTRRRAGMAYSSVSGAVGLTSRDDERDLVMLSTTDEVLSYSPEGWACRGDWVHCHVGLDPFPRGAWEAWDPSMAETGSVRLVAWEDRRGGVRARFVSTQGVSLSEEFRIAGHVSRAPRVELVGSSFHVYFISGTMAAPTFNVAALPPSRPTEPSASYTTIATNIRPGDWLAPHPTYDIAVDGSRAFVVYPISGSAARLAVIRQDGVIGTSGTNPSYPDPVTWNEVTQAAVALSHDRSILAVVGISVPGATPGIVGSFRSATTLTSMDSFSDNDESLTHVRLARRLTCGFDPDSDNRLRTFVELSSSDAADRRVFQWHLQPFGGFSSGSLVRHSSLASKPFVLGGDLFAWTTHVHPTQGTDFLVRCRDGLVAGRSRPGLARTDISGVLPAVSIVGDTATRAACQVDRLALPGTSGSAYQDRHVRIQSVEYQPAYSWRPVDVDGVLHFGGGWLGTYDGAQVTEHGFSLAAEASASVAAVPAGHGVASYIYAVVPEALDARGNRHIGGFTGFIQVTATGSGDLSTTSASLHIRTIAHTMRDGSRAPDIRFGVYRTGPNGTTLQRVDDPAKPVINLTGSDWVVFHDRTTEAQRAAGEVLYTHAEDMNVEPPSPRHLALAGDRLYAADLEGDRYSIAASKLRLGGAVAFTDDGFLSVDAAGGQVTALAPLDDRVVAFKRGRIYAFAADGPGNSLLDDTPFPLAGLVTSDVGVPEDGPAVPVAGTSAQGIFFRSERGARLLDRALQVQDIGGGPRAYDHLTVVAGVQVPNRDEVRLHTAEGTTLSLDLRFGQWSTYDYQPAVSSCRWDGRTAYAREDGYVYVDSTGSFLDGSHTFPVSITTGWIPFATLQGNHRIRAIQLLGEFLSPHTVRVEAAYDYRDDFQVLKEISATGSLDLTVYGGGSEFDGGQPYGSGSYSSRDPVYQFTVLTKRQRMQAIRLRISDVDRSEDGGSFRLTEVQLKVASVNPDHKGRGPKRR